MLTSFRLASSPPPIGSFQRARRCPGRSAEIRGQRTCCGRDRKEEGRRGGSVRWCGGRPGLGDWDLKHGAEETGEETSTGGASGCGGRGGEDSGPGAWVEWGRATVSSLDVSSKPPENFTKLGWVAM